MKIKSQRKRSKSVDNQPAEEPWISLQERIRPMRHISEFIGRLALLVVLSLFWLGGFLILGAMINFALTREWRGVLFLGVFAVIWFWQIGKSMIWWVRDIVSRLSGRRVFKAGNASTEASILRREVVVDNNAYSTDYYYWLLVEISPTMASIPAGIQQYKLSVSKELWDQLADEETVTLFYAVQNPRVLIIEGE